MTMNASKVIAFVAKMQNSHSSMDMDLIEMYVNN